MKIIRKKKEGDGSGIESVKYSGNSGAREGKMNGQSEHGGREGTRKKNARTYIRTNGGKKKRRGLISCNVI